ncbi:hypothetical protein CANCADRAFT_23832 [Tortispora caseinolytica NRRL Y-17796]|uniref:Cytochrome c oxidase assembly protein COX16, mitochondrial n=1 Tax=Tortispora caseinolytica NRRL Y-17796 TaxID=767744 RepID=A0A1E4TJU3_9ASCO|nr:hypothetical protein CANCADRAFT_23832 [Tortispora caseinolytica NRRL Y-17796]
MGEYLPKKPFRSTKQEIAWRNSFRGRYMNAVRKHSFLFLGLPFFVLLFAGSVVLSQFTAVRYEQYDRKVTQVSEEEALSVKGNRRKVNPRDEYYKLLQLGEQDWDQKRVPRQNGEDENVW